MSYTKTFSHISKQDVATAGGKGASLGEMTQAGIPVPPGFVILAQAFDEFLEVTDLDVELDAILDNVNHEAIHEVDNASEKIRALIMGKEISPAIADEITQAFNKLGADYVAVRSSATSEDSADAAWAGQLESYLNTTEKDLLENVKKCWASLFTPRAIFYRFEKGYHNPPSKGGEGSFGKDCPPDKGELEGVNQWRDLSESQGAKPTLTDHQVLELSQLVQKIEKHYGFPVDVEWAREKGKFYIVQSRPITTLKK